MQTVAPMIVQPVRYVYHCLFFFALIHRGMSNADGWPYDSAAGPLIIALFDFHCYCFDSPGGGVKCTRLAL